MEVKLRGKQDVPYLTLGTDTDDDLPTPCPKGRSVNSNFSTHTRDIIWYRITVIISLVLTYGTHRDFSTVNSWNGVEE